MLIVEKAVVAIDIHEIAAIFVGLFAVWIEYEFDPMVDQHTLCLCRSLGAVTLDWFARIYRLRSIDAQNSHRDLASGNTSDEGVAIDHVYDAIERVRIDAHKIFTKGAMGEERPQRGGENAGDADDDNNQYHRLPATQLKYRSYMLRYAHRESISKSVQMLVKSGSKSAQKRIKTSHRLNIYKILLAWYQYPQSSRDEKQYKRRYADTAHYYYEYPSATPSAWNVQNDVWTR